MATVQSSFLRLRSEGFVLSERYVPLLHSDIGFETENSGLLLQSAAS